MLFYRGDKRQKRDGEVYSRDYKTFLAELGLRLFMIFSTMFMVFYWAGIFDDYWHMVSVIPIPEWILKKIDRIHDLKAQLRLKQDIVEDKAKKTYVADNRLVYRDIWFGMNVRHEKVIGVDDKLIKVMEKRVRGLISDSQVNKYLLAKLNKQKDMLRRLNHLEKRTDEALTRISIAEEPHDFLNKFYTTKNEILKLESIIKKKGSYRYIREYEDIALELRSRVEEIRKYVMAVKDRRSLGLYKDLVNMRWQSIRNVKKIEKVNKRRRRC